MSLKSKHKEGGMVYLVGAGPGDPGLITVKGSACLRNAEVVVYDALVNPILLSQAPRSAEFIYAGKRAQNHSMTQEEINALLVKLGRQGRRVVRLKGGDPFVFGRGGEEAEALAREELPYEIVPGITSAIAAPAYAGIPVTHREFTSSVTVVSGHEDPSKKETSIDWAALARLNSTLVFLMGASRIEEIASKLLEQGMKELTPAAIIRWGTMGKQQTVAGTLANISQLAKEKKMGSPSVIVIGEVASLHKQLNWFEQKPLFGQKVVVTRTREHASELSRLLLDRGAEVMELPTIRIEPSARQIKELTEVLQEIGSYDWIIFSSPNGVEHFFRGFFALYQDIRSIGGARIAAVGPSTASKLNEYHLQVDLQPKEAVAEALVEEFSKGQDCENVKFLVLRGDLSRDVIRKGLHELGGIVDDVEVYRTAPEIEDPTGNLSLLGEEGADWITFTSSSTVENFCKLLDFKDLKKKFPGIRVASIGPVTTQTAKELGVPVAIEAEEHTLQGVISAMEKEIQKKSVFK